MSLTSFLREVARRTKNFFIGPHPEFYVWSQPWKFAWGIIPYWWSAPGFHFERVGITILFFHWRVEIAWVDNN